MEQDRESPDPEGAERDVQVRQTAQGGTRRLEGANRLVWMPRVQGSSRSVVHNREYEWAGHSGLGTAAHCRDVWILLS